ncbi:DivIVA domain-containing protein [Spiroplasma endosymbiont of Labia minor]|uniref:DivIVA domain-containing protein n=1 Tax=Spiroplasma endosymbiont of Labia minor TaxID=3066305 RepID=UPI0030CE7FDF
MKTIKFTSLDVNKKEFPVEYKGYKVEEVDSFLDDIVNDYQKYEKLIEEKTQRINKLEEELSSASEQYDHMVSTLKLTEQQMDTLVKSGSNSSAVIKRIADLERKVSDKNR